MIYRVSGNLLDDLCSTAPFVKEEVKEICPDMAIETILNSLEESRKVTIIIHIGELDLIEAIVEVKWLFSLLLLLQHVHTGTDV